MSQLRLTITYDWAGLESECLPHATRVMEMLEQIKPYGDGSEGNKAAISMNVVIRSGRSNGVPSTFPRGVS